ncbi:hypothetical protein L1049_015730 [Liquidambar formosana]|uniref:RNase H type-1 domain-containing protein n=1 Tax=Liquidambar formosana TaxID=63359 RepID=A0AAP0RY93_LIQFO
MVIFEDCHVTPLGMLSDIEAKKADFFASATPLEAGGVGAHISVGVDPAVAKAKAARLAITMARDKLWNQIWVEGDSQAIIDLFSPSLDVPWHYEVIISDIRHGLGQVSSASFCKIPRVANGVADAMAKWALRVGFSGFLDATSLPNPVMEACRLDNCGWS